MKKIIVIGAICILIISYIICAVLFQKKELNNDGKFKIVTSFYPIYIIALNLTDGAEDVSVENMTDVNVGCLHEYTLVSKDLVKLENADVFIQNGLGVELFMDKVKSNYPNLKIIDSSINAENIIEEEDEENGHIWLDIDNYISQVQTISDGLCTIDSKNVDIYKKNAEEYIAKLNKIKEELDSLELKEEKIISFNEVYEYLLDYLEIDALEIANEGEESIMSAKLLAEVIDEVNANDIKVIFIDEKDSNRDAKIIANETNAKIYNLNSGLLGEFEKDSYIKQMRENIETIKSVLGK